MGEIGDRIATHPVIGLDASVFIYHLESHPRYRSLASEVLTGVQAGRWAAVTSVITLMELTVRPSANSGL
jgi:predicted nucleic acid-binding protein